VVTTSTLLESAKDHLLARGWTQHRFMRRETGEICLMRALFLASRDLTWPSRPVYHGVAECVAVLQSLVNSASLQDWNDDETRRPEDVLRLLDVGIEAADVQELFTH